MYKNIILKFLKVICKKKIILIEKVKYEFNHYKTNASILY